MGWCHKAAASLGVHWGNTVVHTLTHDYRFTVGPKNNLISLSFILLANHIVCVRRQRRVAHLLQSVHVGTSVSVLINSTTWCAKQLVSGSNGSVASVCVVVLLTHQSVDILLDVLYKDFDDIDMLRSHLYQFLDCVVDLLLVLTDTV